MNPLPWFKLRHDLPEDPKSMDLAERTGDIRAWTHVVELQIWLARHRPDGNLSGIPLTIIGRNAGRTTDAKVFAEALYASGWIDRRTHIMTEFAEEQKAHAKRMEADRARKAKPKASDSSELPADAPPEVPQDTPLDPPLRTQRSGESTRSSDLEDSQKVLTPASETPPTSERSEDAEGQIPEVIDSHPDSVLRAHEWTGSAGPKRALQDASGSSHPPQAAQTPETTRQAAVERAHSSTDRGGTGGDAVGHGVIASGEGGEGAQVRAGGGTAGRDSNGAIHGVREGANARVTQPEMFPSEAVAKAPSAPPDATKSPKTKGGAAEDVLTVLTYWRGRVGMPRADLLAPERTKRIARWLKAGWSVERLCLVVDGALKDGWLMGFDPGSKGFRDVETIFRDVPQMERLEGYALDEAMPLARKGQSAPPRHGQPAHLNTLTHDFTNDWND